MFLDPFPRHPATVDKYFINLIRLACFCFSGSKVSGELLSEMTPQLLQNSPILDNGYTRPLDAMQRVSEVTTAHNSSSR
jgi:hypothetical protein